MALKGYLASGFQKLIGASRLKGANDQWIGEYNRQNYTATTVPISAFSTVPGFNYIDWAPTADVSILASTALFNTNPTTETVVFIRNSSATRTIYFAMGGSASGSVTGAGAVYVIPGQTIMLIYDVSAARWREISRSAQYLTFAATVSSSSISLGSARMQTIQVSASADQTVTSLNPGYGVSAGDIVYIACSQSTNPITLQQDVNNSVFNGMLMNGDYILTNGGVIAFMYNGTKWQEISRNMVGGYV